MDTSPILGKLPFVDSAVRLVFADAGGRQYILDAGGARCYGTWLRDEDATDVPLVVPAPETP